MPRILGLVLLLPLLELIAFLLVASGVGFGKAVLLQLAISLIGLAMLGSLVSEAKASMKRGEGVVSLALDGKHGARGLAGLLFAMPGFITDALGVVALVPELRARLSRLIGGAGIGRQPVTDAVRPDPAGAGPHWSSRRSEPDTLDLNAADWREVKPAERSKG